MSSMAVFLPLGLTPCYSGARSMEILDLLLAGLAAGDALGATAEFTPQTRVPQLYAEHSAAGWPFRPVGGGAFRWRAGEPTDDTDMALCIVDSFHSRKEFAPEDVAARFVAWMKSGPPDIGGTTRRTLQS